MMPPFTFLTAPHICLPRTGPGCQSTLCPCHGRGALEQGTVPPCSLGAVNGCPPLQCMAPVSMSVCQQVPTSIGKKRRTNFVCMHDNKSDHNLNINVTDMKMAGKWCLAMARHSMTATKPCNQLLPHHDGTLMGWSMRGLFWHVVCLGWFR